MSAWIAADHTLQDTKENNEWQMHCQTQHSISTQKISKMSKVA